MHLSTFIFRAFALTATTASALGINCRGSGFCPRATWSNSAPGSITQILRDAVWASDKDPSTVYNSGDHIICVGSNQAITFTGGTTQKGVTGSFSLSGNIHEGGICLFPQGASLTLAQIRPLTDAVLEHGCKTCGSVPVHFADQGSNDPKWGILTFNYVKNPYCAGNCISATGKSRIRRTNGSFAI
ncbi:hypothetical protein MMC31_003303 [Peltigera leucophlebia]|nr:hypothetical protein [Peltigera leucophlebia]